MPSFVEIRSIYYENLKELCHDAFSHFSDYFEIEGNLKIKVF